MADEDEPQVLEAAAPAAAKATEGEMADESAHSSPRQATEPLEPAHDQADKSAHNSPRQATEHAEPAHDQARERAATIDELARKLKVTLPKSRPPPIGALVFESWWVEKSTKRVVEIALNLTTERFLVTLDKSVSFLSSDVLFNPQAVSYLETIRQDTKVLECNLHEKFSDNQHALSLELPHLQCWDLHVGAKINLFGRPTTLMSSALKTGAWLDYHARGLRAIKERVEAIMRKYEQVPLKPSLKDTRRLDSSKRDWEQGSAVPPAHPAPSVARERAAIGLGGDDLRSLIGQVHQLCDRLAAYRPKMGLEFHQLLALFAAQYVPTDDLPAPSSL